MNTLEGELQKSQIYCHKITSFYQYSGGFSQIRECLPLPPIEALTFPFTCSAKTPLQVNLPNIHKIVKMSPIHCVLTSRSQMFQRILLLLFTRFSVWKTLAFEKPHLLRMSPNNS